MNIKLDFNYEEMDSCDLHIVSGFSRKKDDKTTLVNNHWSDDAATSFANIKTSSNFNGSKDSSFKFYTEDGTPVYAAGLGEKTKASWEDVRRAIAGAYKAAQAEKVKQIGICLDSFTLKKDAAKATRIVAETLHMTAYNYNKYKSDSKKPTLTTVVLACGDKKAKRKTEVALEEAFNTASSVNLCRDFVNEVPNVLRAPEFAKRVEADAKKALKGKGVKVKMMGKTELKKEKMELFLSVNAGSAFDARLVHLTYTPKKANSKTKHIALVGKGLVFDTGGYSLKPSGSIAGMKFDMGGAATLYAAFRAAVLNNSPYKITCILGMTDNAVSGTATMPDSIVKARNGKTVEILNTDAEGRLVLGDCLDYACDQKPDVIIDAATLTGACLIALGTEVCAVMGNENKLTKKLLDSAKAEDEYMWELPIIPEWRKDMKSNIADLKNIGGTRWGGTAKAAAFLQEFVREGVDWAHLDIAGVCDSQSHLPYCPTKGGSGLIVRTLNHYLTTK